MAGRGFLYGRLVSGRRTIAPPVTDGDDVSRGQRRRRGEDVVAREVSDPVVTSAAPLLDEGAGDRVPIQRREPGPHDRRDGGRDAGDVADDALEALALPGLDVDEEERRRLATALEIELLAEARLEQPHGHQQHDADAERDDHADAVTAGTGKIRQSLTQGERRKPGPSSTEPGEGTREQGQHEQRGSDGAQEDRADGERDGLPEDEGAGPGHQRERRQPSPCRPGSIPLDVATKEQRRRRGSHLAERPERDEHRQPRADRHATEKPPRLESSFERERHEARQERAHERGQGHAEKGAGEAADETEPRRLDEIGGEQEPRRRSQALEDRNRVTLARHERPNRRGHADSTHQQAGHPDEAEVAGELTVEAAPAGPALVESAHSNGRIGNHAGELGSHGGCLQSVRQPQQGAVIHAAAEPDQAGAVERRSRHEEPRPE